jgi:hypothetical protein
MGAHADSDRRHTFSGKLIERVERRQVADVVTQESGGSDIVLAGQAPHDVSFREFDRRLHFDHHPAGEHL